MARIFTTPAVEQAAKAFLHDLLFTAGLKSQNQRPNGELVVFSRYSSSVTSAKTICDELVNRDFANINNEIYDLAGYRINVDMTGTNAEYKRLTKEFVAKSLVYLAEQLNLYWDDTIRTPYEIDEFKKTYLGTAVYKYGRIISAVSNKTKSSSTTSSSGRRSGAPKNGYKQSGPQSANVRDLKGNPGDKVLADTSFIYKIIGENSQSKNTPNVFIKPLSASGASGNTNKVSIGSGNGYTDCTCYFDDPNDATDFLDKVIAAGIVPSNITNLRVVKNKADSNGYFIVGTEFGDCAVSAKTLNEALAESKMSVEEDITGGWKKATENYTEKERKELHTWMRRG